MINLRFYLDNARKSIKTGLIPIKANISFSYKNENNESIYKDISKTVGGVKLAHWSKSQQRVKESFIFEEANLKTNSILQSWEDDSKKYFSELATHKIEVTEDIIRKYFKGEKLNFDPEEEEKKRFWPAYEEFLKLGELEKAHNTNRNRKTIKKKLEDFEVKTGYKMTFDSINLVFFDRLKEFILDTNGYSYNYLSAITDKFKAFMTWSLERNYHNNTTYKKFSAPEKEGTIIHLTFPELQKLINHDFKNEKLQKASDFFCFGCLTGLRYCDLQKLTKDNISNINSLTEHKTFFKNTAKTEFKPKHELITTHRTENIYHFGK